MASLMRFPSSSNGVPDQLDQSPDLVSQLSLRHTFPLQKPFVIIATITALCEQMIYFAVDQQIAIDKSRFLRVVLLLLLIATHTPAFEVQPSVLLAV